MEAPTERVIGMLNKLIEANNDRIAEYELAKSETKNRALKNNFQIMVRESQALRDQLAAEVIAEGGSPTQTRSVSGSLHRVWMDIRVAMTGKDLKTILNACRYGEEAVLGLYEEALKANFPVPVNVLDFLISQKHKLQQARLRINELYNTIGIAEHANHK
ncbi:MAG TPA: PA2169 family four-helix-bundle protein [Bacteroidia bacterium]|jgi:uncharacterized protein (TIGR02284 family)|nr:PA2169 family four-helix-bundle protein [Bacteroidia bacterium]